MLGGYEVREDDSGEFMTVPNGAKAAGVSGSVRNIIACEGLIVGKGIVLIGIVVDPMKSALCK